MASNKRTIYLGLDYSDFTGGITEVNRKMGLLDAEFKLATEQAKNYGNETDLLGTKHDYLSQKIALQNQKVEAAKKAYDEAMKSTTASAKEIDTLDKKLLTERTTLEKLEGQLKETDDKQKRLESDTKSFGDTIRNVASSLGINVNPAVEKLAKKFDEVNVAAGLAVIAIAAITTGLYKCATSAAETADELLTLSSTTGLTTTELQKLQYAADFVDVSVDTMSGSMKKLTQTMNSAREGSKTSSEAFKSLHVKVTQTNGELRDSTEVFYEVIDKLGKIKNETERDALAMQLFGKSASELNPLIEAGSDTLRQLGVEAENLGIIMSEGDVKSFGKLNDAMDKFDNTIEALKNSLGLTLLPILTALFTAIAAIPVPVLQVLVTLASVVATVVLVVKAIESLQKTGNSLSKFYKLVTGGLSKTTLIIMGVVAALIVLATVIGVIMGKSNDLNQAMSSVNGTISNVQGTVQNAQTTTYRAQNHASGTKNFKGGQTWVGEDGAELVTLPGGSSITPMSEIAKSEINTFYVTIDAKNVSDFQKVVDLCKNQQMAYRRA